MKSVREMKALYNKAKSAKVNEPIHCPTCGTLHTKATYNKIFCSNAKTKYKKNCKDMFWNNVDPQKKCRKTPYFYDVISNVENDFHPYEGLNDDDYKNF